MNKEKNKLNQRVNNRGHKIVYINVIVVNDKVYVFLGDLELIILVITLIVNVIFAYVSHDFLLPPDAGTFIRFMSGIGGLGYLLVFFLTSVSLYFEGYYLHYSIILIFELTISILGARV